MQMRKKRFSADHGFRTPTLFIVFNILLIAILFLSCTKKSEPPAEENVPAGLEQTIDGFWALDYKGTYLNARIEKSNIVVCEYIKVKKK